MLTLIFISSFGNTQGQRRSPTKMVGGVKSYLDSNPIPNRDPSVQFSSVAQSCQTLFDPTNCSTPGLPVHHQLPESTQTHVHWVGDAIQPSHPLSFPSPPVLNLSQHQGLFKWVNPSHQVAKVLRVSASPSVLPMNILDWFPLGWTGGVSLQSKGL